MKRATNLLLSLQERGATIWIQEGELRWRAPKGTIVAADLAALRAERQPLFELLQGCLSISSVPLEPRIQQMQIPLTAMQRMPWYFAEAPHPRTRPFGFRISGSLRFEVLQRSLDLLVQRHEPLRTRILMIGDRPSQHITSRDFRLELVDMRGEFSYNVPQFVEHRITEFIDKTIEPSTDPLFDARLFRVTDDEHILVVSIDHVISDSITLTIFTEELWTLYQQLTNGQSVSLPALSLQFADYALWLEAILPTWLNVHAPYWEARLAGAPSIRWPRDSNLAEGRGIDYAALKVSLGEGLRAGLADFARRERILPGVVVLAAYIAVVSRWCNQSDLTVTLVDSGRHRAELTRMFGLLATHLHLRVELNQQQTYRDLLGLVKLEFYSALYHRDFDWVPSLIPQFQSDLLFNWDPEWGRLSSNEIIDKSITDSIRVNWVDLELSNDAMAILKYDSRYKLELVCYYQGDQLTARFDYRADVFSRQSIDGFARNLKFFLESLISNPSAIVTFEERSLPI